FALRVGKQREIIHSEGQPGDRPLPHGTPGWRQRCPLPLPESRLPPRSSGDRSRSSRTAVQTAISKQLGLRAHQARAQDQRALKTLEGHSKVLGGGRHPTPFESPVPECAAKPHKTSLRTSQSRPARVPVRQTQTSETQPDAPASRSRSPGRKVWSPSESGGSDQRQRSEERRVGKECRTRGA